MKDYEKEFEKLYCLIKLNSLQFPWGPPLYLTNGVQIFWCRTAVPLRCLLTQRPAHTATAIALTFLILVFVFMLKLLSKPFIVFPESGLLCAPCFICLYLTVKTVI